jgi:hypothetical protein
MRKYEIEMFQSRGERERDREKEREREREREREEAVMSMVAWLAASLGEIS